LAAFAGHVGVMPFNPPAPEQYFIDNVMPILLQRGCAAEGCHSPAAMNDLKLRSGTQGFFSSVALEKNYHLIKDDFMAFEVPDVRRSRLVAKHLFAQNGGIAHRGGALMEVDSAAAVMVLQQWADKERAAMSPANPNAGTVKIVYVKRAATAQELL